MAPRVAFAVWSLATGASDMGGVRAEGARPGLRLVWSDPSDVAAGTELAARAEAGDLLARMGVSVSWRRAGAQEIRRTDEVWVVLLGEGPAAPGAPVLGATCKRHPFAPVVWVRVPNVRSAVGVPRSGTLLGVGLHFVAVALGRVIAHEVVHAVVPSVAHGSGLMSERFDRRQLVAPSIRVDPETALALQAALRGDPVGPSAGGSVLATADEEKDR